MQTPNEIVHNFKMPVSVIKLQYYLLNVSLGQFLKAFGLLVNVFH